MARLSQSKLIRQAATFITNGANPEAQVVIANVGYNPAALTAGQTLLDTVRNGQATIDERLSAQKRATNTEKSAREAAQKEVTSLAQTARVLFADDNPTLTALGLETRYETVTDPETGESSTQAARASRDTAVLLSQWRQLVQNTATLPPAQQGALTAAGWGSARITTLSELVESFASADIAQQEAIHNYQQASADYAADVQALDDWFSRARRLCLVAIKDHDPNGRQNLRELLGLTV